MLSGSGAKIQTKGKFYFSYGNPLFIPFLFRQSKYKKNPFIPFIFRQSIYKKIRSYSVHTRTVPLKMPVTSKLRKLPEGKKIHKKIPIEFIPFSENYICWKSCRVGNKQDCRILITQDGLQNYDVARLIINGIMKCTEPMLGVGEANSFT